MPITLDPKRIRPGTSGMKPDRRAPDSHDIPPKPARAHVNIIPSPESLRTLIAGAVTALRKGVRWDRGTILNVVV